MRGAAYDRGVLLIDPPAWPAHGRLWSHLVSDTSYRGAARLRRARSASRGRASRGTTTTSPRRGMPRSSPPVPCPIDGRELLKRLRDSGLRISKRKHERVLQSTPDAPWLPAGRSGGRHRVATGRPAAQHRRGAARRDRPGWAARASAGPTVGPDLPSRPVAPATAAGRSRRPRRVHRRRRPAGGVPRSSATSATSCASPTTPTRGRRRSRASRCTRSRRTAARSRPGRVDRLAGQRCRARPPALVAGGRRCTSGSSQSTQLTTEVASRAAGSQSRRARAVR